MAVLGCTARWTSTDVDRRMGAEAARQVEEQIGLYGSSKADVYLRAVGERLVGNLEDREFDFTFRVVDLAEPNAFAAPGGYIYVSRSLITLANTEDELACVLAHEISHVTERHSVKQAKKGIVPGLLTLPGKLVGVVSEDLGNLINAPLESIGGVYLAKHSRKQESEADEAGLQLAARSGYDPASLATILLRIERDVEMQTGQVRQFGFFDTHPMTPERVGNVHEQSARVEWTRVPPIAWDHEEFLFQLDGIAIGENPSRGLFRDEQFLHPDLNFTITFPNEWVTVNTPTAVGAQSPSGEALMILGVAETPVDPAEAGRTFESELAADFQLTPTESRAIEVGNWPGYLVLVTDASGSEPLNIYYVWVRMDGLLYQLIGVGADRHRDELREAVLSLRPMTPSEQQSIIAVRLRIVEAKPGETIAELSRRTGNLWPPAYTAMINDVPEGLALEGGRLVKTAQREPYHPAPPAP